MSLGQKKLKKGDLVREYDAESIGIIFDSIEDKIYYIYWIGSKHTSRSVGYFLRSQTNDKL